jgi:hypothetical protein
MKAVSERLQAKGEDVAEFKGKANEFAKKIVANFKDYEFVRFVLPLMRAD